MKKVEIKGRSRVQTVLAFLLLISVLISASGCRRSVSPPKEGLVIKENINEPISNEVGERVKSTVSMLITLYLEGTVTGTLPQTTLSEVEKVSEDIYGALLRYNLSENTLDSLCTALNDVGTYAVSDIVAIKTGDGDGSFEGIKALYLELSELVGSDLVGRLAYGITLYSYEYRYEKKIRHYNTYGYEYLLAEANAILEDKNILEGSIGEGSFVSVVKLGFMMSELLLGGALENGRLSAFSDEELLTIVTHVNASSLDIESPGWELLISMLAPDSAPQAEASYALHLLHTARAYNDISSFSAAMVEFTGLISFIQRTMTASDIALMRSEGIGACLSGIFARFGEEEWAMLARVGELSLNGEYYETACRYYGDDFAVYASAITPCTLAELRYAVEAEDFTEYLERYIAGISPAFTYGWQNDNS